MAVSIIKGDGSGVLRTDKEICEICLPAYMWSLLLQSMANNGYDVRNDMEILLDRALRRDLEKENLKPEDIARISKKIENEGHGILTAGGSGDNLAKLAVGLARFTVSLIGEGWPITENVQLIAIAFNEEGKDYIGDFGGEQAIATTASNILREGQRREFFLMNSGFRYRLKQKEKKVKKAARKKHRNDWV